MPVLARRVGEEISKDARKRIAGLRHDPAIDTWRNPLTRTIARRLSNDAWRRSLEELDFDYRLTPLCLNETSCLQYEADAETRSETIVLYIHGGDFVAGSPTTHAANILPACHLSGSDGIGVEYSLLPEAAYPTQIDEATRVYRALLERAHNRKIVLLADGTGAAIALSALMRWRAEGLFSPAGAIFLSPCVDGLGASDTQITADRHDPVIRSYGGKYVRRLFQFYAPSADLRNPDVSPLYGKFDGLPPMLIHVGSREVLLGDAARLSEAARAAGVEVSLRVFDGMFHRFHMLWRLAESRAAHSDVADFLSKL